MGLDKSLDDELPRYCLVPYPPGITLAVEGRVEAPYERNAILVVGPVSRRGPNVHELGLGGITLEVSLRDIEAKVPARFARLGFLDAGRRDLALQGGVTRRGAEGRQVGPPDLSPGLDVEDSASAFALDDVAVRVPLDCADYPRVDHLARAPSVVVPRCERVLRHEGLVDGAGAPQPFYLLVDRGLPQMPLRPRPYLRIGRVVARRGRHEGEDVMVSEVGLVGMREREVAVTRDVGKGLYERDRNPGELVGSRADRNDERRSLDERVELSLLDFGQFLRFDPPCDRRVVEVVLVVGVIKAHVFVPVDRGY